MQSTNKKILDIINLVKQTEIENGLTEFEISKKYCCGGCRSLANLIKSQFEHNEDVSIICFTNTYLADNFCTYFRHYSIVTNLDANKKLKPESLIFDINGAHKFSEFYNYLNTVLKKHDENFNNDQLYKLTPYKKEKYFCKLNYEEIFNPCFPDENYTIENLYYLLEENLHSI